MTIEKSIPETFIFMDEDENACDIWLPVFSENTQKICDAEEQSFSLLAA